LIGKGSRGNCVPKGYREGDCGSKKWRPSKEMAEGLRGDLSYGVHRGDAHLGKWVTLQRGGSVREQSESKVPGESLPKGEYMNSEMWKKTKGRVKAQRVTDSRWLTEKPSLENGTYLGIQSPFTVLNGASTPRQCMTEDCDRR